MKNSVKVVQFTAFTFAVYAPLMFLAISDNSTIMGFGTVFWTIVSTVGFLGSVLFIKHYKIGYPKKSLTFTQKLPYFIAFFMILVLFIDNVIRNKATSYTKNAHAESVVASTINIGSPNIELLKKDDAGNNSSIHYMDEIFSILENKYGYFSLNAIQSDYDSYDNSILEQMGEQGDLKALDVLGSRFLEALDTKNAYRIYNKSAMFGSTAALRNVAQLSLTLSNNYDGKSIEQLRKQAQINNLTYYQVALMRGDESVLGLISTTLTKSQIQLSESDKTKIFSDASNYYNLLETKRALRGLPQFDNSTPSYVHDYYMSINEQLGSVSM